MSLRAPAVLFVVVLLPLGRPAAQRLSGTDRAQLVTVLWSDARSSFAGWARVRADWDSALAASLRAATPPQPDPNFYRRLMGRGRLCQSAVDSTKSLDWGRPAVARQDELSHRA